MEEEIRLRLQSHRKVIDEIERLLIPSISSVVELISGALKRGNKVLIMGNGGSAADAQHMAAELVGRFNRERRGLAAIALTTDTSLLTALGNDYGFDAIFRRQVEALANPGDVVIGISTSGGSLNVLKAIELARGMGCATIALLGRDGGPIMDCVDIPLVVRSDETAHIQEGHITIIHIICDLVERGLFPAGFGI